jgi:hypothetical protein
MPNDNPQQLLYVEGVAHVPATGCDRVTVLCLRPDLAYERQRCRDQLDHAIRVMNKCQPIPCRDADQYAHDSDLYARLRKHVNAVVFDPLYEAFERTACGELQVFDLVPKGRYRKGMVVPHIVDALDDIIIEGGKAVAASRRVVVEPQPIASLVAAHAAS